MDRREFLAGAAAFPLAAGAKNEWDAGGQKKRRAQIYGLHQQAVAPLFNDRGQWIGTSHKPGQREFFWACLSLLSGEQTREKGNAVAMEGVNQHPKGGSAFEHMGGLLLLLKNGGDLTPAAKSL